MPEPYIPAHLVRLCGRLTDITDAENMTRVRAQRIAAFFRDNPREVFRMLTMPAPVVYTVRFLRYGGSEIVHLDTVGDVHSFVDYADGANFTCDPPIEGINPYVPDADSA